MSIDVLFVSPGNARAIYQDLSRDFSAIEPPTWALLLAESVRAVGFVPEILDVNAEQLSLTDAVERIRKSSPRLICFVVYGQNPNSGTVNMGGAVALEFRTVICLDVFCGGAGGAGRRAACRRLSWMGAVRKTAPFSF